jgi:L-arabinonolactonase
MRKAPPSASLFVDCRCTLGEGIIWWTARRALLWTDISESRLWMHDAAGTRNWALPDRLGSFAPCASGRLLLGLAKGLFVADLPSAPDAAVSVTPLAGVEPDIPSTRVNDGRTDRAGNFVFGTMGDEPDHPAIGSFYQWSARYGLRRLNLPRAGIANSICFSPDGQTMYFCDSPQGQIMQCRYDAASASVSGIRVFATIDPSKGCPDGSAVDTEGSLWNAAWGAGMVRRYRRDGTIGREIAVPARNPSCVVFGGATMNELYITTARQDMSEAELDRTPAAGGIYRADVEDLHGLPDALFRDT